MKKIFIIITVMIILLANKTSNAQFSLKNYFDGEYYVYSTVPNENSIDLGFCYMLQTENCKNVIGESMIVSNIEPCYAIKSMGGEIVDYDVLQNGLCVLYAYTKNNPISKIINNKRVNLQVACYDEYCVIGWPLILGGY